MKVKFFLLHTGDLLHQDLVMRRFLKLEKLFWSSIYEKSLGMIDLYNMQEVLVMFWKMILLEG